MVTLKNVLITGGLVLSIAACDIQKTEEGEMPKVSIDPGEVPEYEIKKTEEGRAPDIDVEGGNMPEYDVDGPDVDVKMKEKTIKVPDVDIDMPNDEE